MWKMKNLNQYAFHSCLDPLGFHTLLFSAVFWRTGFSNCLEVWWNVPSVSPGGLMSTPLSYKMLLVWQTALGRASRSTRGAEGGMWAILILGWWRLCSEGAQSQIASLEKWIKLNVPPQETGSLENRTEWEQNTRRCCCLHRNDWWDASSEFPLAELLCPEIKSSLLYCLAFASSLIYFM